MKYFYKKGRIKKNEEVLITYAISSRQLRSFDGGLPIECFETNDVKDFITYCVKEKSSNIYIVDIEQDDFDLIVEQLSSYITSLEIQQIKSIDYDKLAMCEKVKNILIKGNKLELSLWDAQKNKNLETLELIGLNKLINQENLKNITAKELIIKARDTRLNYTQVLLVEDFSVFPSMPNLEKLDLFIAHKKEKEQDLFELSKLQKIQKISLPKSYFTFNQLAWLKSKLGDVEGIGPIKEQKWSKRIEKYVYTINGSNMPWEYVDYSGCGINKYIKRFDKLVQVAKDSCGNND